MIDHGDQPDKKTGSPAPDVPLLPGDALLLLPTPPRSETEVANVAISMMGENIDSIEDSDYMLNIIMVRIIKTRNNDEKGLKNEYA